MVRAFLSYSHENRTYVPLLKRMLEFHRVATWLDQGDIEPGTKYRDALERALASTDCLLVAVTEGAARSKWVTREIATYRAVQPDARIVPLVFEDVDLDDVFDGLGSYRSISFADDIDAGFAQLLERVFGVPYLAVPERRGSPADRRSAERRGIDRRAATADQRLRIGMWRQFADTTGRGEYEEFGNDDPPERGVTSPFVPAARWGTPVPPQTRGRDRTVAVFRLADMFAREDSELSHYTFSDEATGHAVPITSELLAELVHRTLRELELDARHGRPYNVYVVEKLAFALSSRFVVAARDRRQHPRRTGEDRRPAI